MPNRGEALPNGNLTATRYRSRPDPNRCSSPPPRRITDAKWARALAGIVPERYLPNFMRLKLFGADEVFGNHRLGFTVQIERNAA